MTASPDRTERSSDSSDTNERVPSPTRETRGPIGLFVRHRTAANLLMVLMLIAGAFGLNRMTTQFFPDFGVDTIAVTITWPAASAADVDANIVRAVDREVRFIDDVRSVKTTAYEGHATVFIEFEPGSDMQRALSNVEMAVGQIATLPEDAETPQVQRVVRYDGLSRILISGPYSETALKSFATQIRDGLLDRGVDKVNLSGFRNEEILVEIRPETMRRLQIGLDDVARQIQAATDNIPSGEVAGRAHRQIRSSGRIASARELGEIDVQSLTGGERLLLRDIADVRIGFDDDSATYWRNGDRAIVLQAMRTPDADALAIADTVSAYLEEIRSTLPPNLNIETFDIQAELIRSRLDLLIENGAMGLAIVLAVLFLFLNARVAFWVAVGIPISLAATMLIMWFAGQSINMISMFAIIMVLGIVVDDAIVVGEHSEALHRRGLNARFAAETAARRMAAPVFCASITTIAAFLPLLLITDTIGAIIRTVPIVAVAVIVASLIECFLVLPGHMRHALEGEERKRTRTGLLSPLFGVGLLWLWPAVPILVSMRAIVRILLAIKLGFDRGFEHFRKEIFLPVLRLTIRWRYTTVAIAVTALIAASALVAGGRVDFVFFPAPEADTVYANLWFTAGTPESRTQLMLRELERSVEAVDRGLSSSGKRRRRGPVSLRCRRQRHRGASLGGSRQRISYGRHVRATPAGGTPEDRFSPVHRGVGGGNSPHVRFAAIDHQGGFRRSARPGRGHTFFRRIHGAAESGGGGRQISSADDSGRVRAAGRSAVRQARIEPGTDTRGTGSEHHRPKRRAAGAQRLRGDHCNAVRSGGRRSCRPGAVSGGTPDLRGSS